MSASTQLTIAVVGDVHDQWSPEDEQALVSLGVDLVLFVGDFGNESLTVVSQVAALPLPKAVVLGNHDAWYTATPWGQKKAPYDRSCEDRVQRQIDLLGTAHVGYAARDFPNFNLAVVGGRPFSWGGPKWQNRDFYQERFGVNGFSESATQIVNAARQVRRRTLILIGHNGPSGLGSEPEDICGKDWQPVGGDFGDPDLAQAIAELRQAGCSIPLVTFGHMHHRLRHTKSRLRTQFKKDAQGTIFLNAAAVPRIVEDGTGRRRRRNFSLVTLTEGQVSHCSLVWVNDFGEILDMHAYYPLGAPDASSA
ncbi:MAG: TIGR04168 family protein [Cyanobacteria bacterium P01_H01_bin.15]